MHNRFQLHLILAVEPRSIALLSEYTVKQPAHWEFVTQASGIAYQAAGVNPKLIEICYPTARCTADQRRSRSDIVSAECYLSAFHRLLSGKDPAHGKSSIGTSA